jgi:hypothetical protein
VYSDFNSWKASGNYSLKCIFILFVLFLEESKFVKLYNTKVHNNILLFDKKFYFKIRNTSRIIGRTETFMYLFWQYIYADRYMPSNSNHLILNLTLYPK